jgi:hypothetical protein
MERGERRGRRRIRERRKRGGRWMDEDNNRELSKMETEDSGG